MSAYSTPSFHISHSSPHLTTLLRESPEKATLQTISADFQAMNMGGFGNRDHTHPHPHLQHHQPHSALDNGSKGMSKVKQVKYIQVQIPGYNLQPFETYTNCSKLLLKIKDKK